MKLNQNVLALLLPCLITGCTTTITNLTPAQQKRSPTGLYPVEVNLDTRRQAMMEETIKPAVIVGFDVYPMQPTTMLSNRWETLVPVPADKSNIYYRFKFEYLVRRIPQARPESLRSPEYKLEIVDK